jgi:lysophospholipase L1-like esterase
LSSLNELRIAVGAFGIVVAAAVLGSPGVLPFALFPWAVAFALLASRAGAVVQVGLQELVSRIAGRLAIVAVVVLVLLAAIVTNVALAVVLFCWIAAFSLIASALVRPPRFVEGFANATLAAVALAGLCGVLEAGLRLPVLARRLGTPQDRARFAQTSDHLEWQNTFGLRSRHETIARTPGARRILAVGDSYTWGDKVQSTDSVWPSLLEKELSRASAALPTEVINLSRVGWNTVQEAEALNQLGWQFSPDRVLLQFYLNDAEARPDEVPGTRGRPKVEPQRRNLIHWSALVWVVKRAFTLSSSRLGDFHGLNPVDTFRDDSPGWHQMRQALREMADSARARGVPITLVLFPDFSPGSWTPATYPYAPIHRKVAQEALAHGFEVLDLTPAYAAQGGNWKRYWTAAYDGHPNPAAQVVAAQAIAEYLHRLGWPSSTGARTAPSEGSITSQEPRRDETGSPF